MPYPYVMGEDKFGEITDTERKAIKDTDKLMSEMEVSLASNGDSQLLRDFKQFRKHFHNLASDRLYDGRIEYTAARKQYAQSVAWLEEFMNNPVKAASLINLFKDYKGGKGAGDIDAALFVFEVSFGIDYEYDAVIDMQTTVRKDPKLVEKTGTIKEKTFSEDETFGHDKEVEQLLAEKERIDAARKKMAKENDLFTRQKQPQPEEKETDYSNESDTYSYWHGRQRFDLLDSATKHLFFELREKMFKIERKLEKSEKTEELSALKKFHEHFHDITNGSIYHGDVYSNEKAQKIYKDSQNSLKEIIEDSKKLSELISTIGSYSNDEEMNNLGTCLIYVSDTFGLNYDPDNFKKIVSEKSDVGKNAVAEAAETKAEKQKISDQTIVLNSEKIKEKVPTPKEIKVKKTELSSKDKIKVDDQPSADDTLVRTGHAAVPVELTLKRLAPNLKVRHRVSFIGGGQSAEMQGVQRDVDAFLLFCENPQDPRFEGLDEKSLLENLKKSAQNYVDEKKKGRWSNTSDENWKPNTQMGKIRYAAVKDILDVVKNRLEQLEDQKVMSENNPSVQAPDIAGAVEVKNAPAGTVNAPLPKVEEKHTVVNTNDSEQLTMKKKDPAVTIVKDEAEEPNIEIDESQLSDEVSKEKFDKNKLYEGKQNVFDMAKQDVKIGSIVGYQNNIRTILNQGKPLPEKFDKMKNDLGKEYAGIIATKCVWKKPEGMIGDVYKEKGSDVYKEQKKAFKADRNKRDAIQNNLINNDKGFDRMMAGVKDWKGLVDTGLKALTPNASEMLRDYMVNKNKVVETKNKKTNQPVIQPNKELKSK